jgi:hypothetical protein
MSGLMNQAGTRNVEARVDAAGTKVNFILANGRTI